MEPTSTADQRQPELEIKASFTENLLDKLDSVIVRRQQPSRSAEPRDR